MRQKKLLLTIMERDIVDRKTSSRFETMPVFYEPSISFHATRNKHRSCLLAGHGVVGRHQGDPVQVLLCMAPPKNPDMMIPPVNTNKHRFSMVSKWCRLSSIHSMSQWTKHKSHTHTADMKNPLLTAFRQDLGWNSGKARVCRQ